MTRNLKPSYHTNLHKFIISTKYIWFDSLNVYFWKITCNERNFNVPPSGGISEAELI